MFESLKVFDVREVAEEDYHVPVIDLTADSLAEPEIFPPPAPVVVGITVSGITWEFVPTASGYQVENLLTGTIWTILAGAIPAPPPIRVVWDGYEWLIQKLIAGAWSTRYVSVNDNVTLNYTPDKVTEWSPENGVAPAPTLVSFDPIASGGIAISGAGDSDVNVDCALVGTMNELNLYSGPSIITYPFSPTVDVLYRVRAFNSAGDGPPSNTVTLIAEESSSPPPVVTGYQIRNYATDVMPGIYHFGYAGIPGTQPEWDGLIDSTTIYTGSYFGDSPAYYIFLDGCGPPADGFGTPTSAGAEISLNGVKSFKGWIYLVFDSLAGVWDMEMTFQADISTQNLCFRAIGDSTDPTDPSGTYTITYSGGNGSPFGNPLGGATFQLDKVF
jgi:hypothetical protein